MSNKIYLGDSVYVDFDGSQFRVFTDNGFGPQNMIYLELEIAESLALYLSEKLGQLEEQ